MMNEHILQALERDGGAKEVVAGGTFCLALTHTGSVLLWGNLPGTDPPPLPHLN